MKNKTIFVTGCSGLLGSYITNLLLKKNYKVIGIDNFSRYGYLEHKFYNNKNFTLIKGDCKNYKLINKYIKISDYVIANAAQIGGIKAINKKQFDMFIENQKIIENTLISSVFCFKNFHMKKIIYISSSMIYEKNKKKISSEGDELNFSFPQSYYAFQKLTAERLVESAYEQYKMPYTIIRPFNIVGLFNKNKTKFMSHVIPDLIKKIKKNKKMIKLYGNGLQKRSFTHAKDIAEIVVKCVQLKKTNNKIYNVGKPGSISIKYLTKLIYYKIWPKGKLLIKKSKMIKNDVFFNEPNIIKLKKDIGIYPKTRIDSSINEILK